MINTRNRSRLKLKCPRCHNILYYKQDDIYDGEHVNERCVMCDCGKEIKLKNKIK